MTTSGSILANSGVGAASGVPALIGVDSQVAEPEYVPVITGYGRPPSSSTSSIRGMSAQVPSPPSSSKTRCDDRGRNGVSSVLPSSTSCNATYRIVRIRSGSDSRSFHGAWSDRYLLASPNVRITSVMAALNRDLDSDSPTEANARLEPSKSARSASVSSPAGGIEPMFLAANEMLRLTRFPQLATSSSLLRRMNSLQVKSVSWFSGPAIAT